MTPADAGGAPHPARCCPECGEWLPHACAAVVTISREKWTGRRTVRIVDRPGPVPQLTSPAPPQQVQAEAEAGA